MRDLMSLGHKRVNKQWEQAKNTEKPCIKSENLKKDN